MKKLIALFVLLAGIAAAQTTTVTISITVPSSAGPVVTAWLKSQCATYVLDANNNPTTACATQAYPDVKSYLSALLTPQIRTAIQQAVAWAIANGDASLPAAVRTAIANKNTAQSAVDAASAAATPTVAVQ